MRRSVLLVAVLLALAGCQRTPPGTITTTSMAGRCASPATYLARGKPSPCLTPGDIRTSDPTVICVRGQASRVRAELTPAQWSGRRAAVMRRYSLTSLKGYTVDHALPLEGGGSNEISNLAPQQQTIAKGKDRAEAGLHAGICKPGVTATKVRALQVAFLKQWGS